MDTNKKVFITGAAGRIGSFLTRSLVGRYECVLTDVHPPDDAQGFPFVAADIADLEAMRAVCQGKDTIVHLAADPNRKATWESLLPRNIIGAYNVFQAASEAGCRRVIFASTINVVAGYPADTQVHTHMPVRPPNLYGATKAWGEAVGRFYADQHGLSVICLRFGAVRDSQAEAIRDLAKDVALFSAILTYADMTRLVIASLEAPDDLRFGIFHGVSNNRWKGLDISDTREVLGYAPEDDSFVIYGVLPPAEPSA